MKKALLLFTLGGLMALGACSRKMCPAYTSIEKTEVSPASHKI